MKKMIVAIILCLFPLTSFAYDGWSEGTIKRIRYQRSRMLINQTGATNPGSCEDVSYLEFLDDGTEFANQVYAAMLTAKAAGINVRLALTGCSQGGTLGRPLITEVWLIE